MVYNPLDREVRMTLTVPLYYTGLTTGATVREQDGEAKEYSLDSQYKINLPVNVPARCVTWFDIEAP
jgi:hypothetical protein